MFRFIAFNLTPLGEGCSFKEELPSDESGNDDVDRMSRDKKSAKVEVTCPVCGADYSVEHSKTLMFLQHWEDPERFMKFKCCKWCYFCADALPPTL